MFKTKSGKHFANPQVGRAFEKAEEGAGHATTKSTPKNRGEMHQSGDSEGVPHPSTGVHKVEVIHKGNNRFVTRHHSENGQQEHEHAGAHEGLSQAFPESAENETPEGDAMDEEANEALDGMMSNGSDGY